MESMRFYGFLALGVALFTLNLSADTKVKMADLPPAVQQAAKEQAKGSTLVGLSKETEDGKTMYEVETRKNGHGRDLLLDNRGTVVEVEEEVQLDQIPAPAKEVIEKKAAGAKIHKVESVTHGSTVSYEADLFKNGKHSEVAVNADGSAHK